MSARVEGARLAVIDLGTNAARFELVEVREGVFARQARERVPLDLGRSVFTTGELSPADIERLSELLCRWRAFIDTCGAASRVVATSALREAPNRASVVRTLEGASGLRVDVLSGEQEAALIGKGALSGAVSRVPTLVIDVGGGSTEILCGRSGVVQWAVSVPVGSNRGWRGIPRDAEDRMLVRDAMLETIERRLDEALLPGATCDAITALLTSGSTRAALRWAAEPSDGCVTAAALGAVHRSLCSLTAKERRNAFGDRAAKVVPAVTILTAVVRRLRAQVLIPCRTGLRHGVLLELAERWHPLDTFPPRAA